MRRPDVDAAAARAPCTSAGLRPASGSSATTTAPIAATACVAVGSSVTTTTRSTAAAVRAAATVSSAMARARSALTSALCESRVLATVRRLIGTTIAQRASWGFMSGILASQQRDQVRPGGLAVSARRRVGFWYRLLIVVPKPLLRLLITRDWRGAENLPAEGGLIIAANHVSEIDPFAVGEFLLDNGRLPRFLAKAELFRKAPVKWVLNGAEQIPVSRNSVDASLALEPAVEALHRGECVLIYPEGSATRDPDLWPMKARTGVARLALLSGAPVIPVAQWGPQEILRYKARRPKLLPRHTMHILVGPPVDLSEFAGKPLTVELLRTATDKVMHRVADQLAELRGEPAPASFFVMSTGSS